jgi:SAM-dependent methyltransferase
MLAYEHPDDARMAAFRRVYSNWLVIDDLYPAIATRFEEAGMRCFLELGGGRVRCRRCSPPRICVVDTDPQMLEETVRPAVRADMAALPLPDGMADGAAVINSLYFLSDPLTGIREARRVLRDGGLFLASSPSRWNDPELEGVDPTWGAPSSFDSDDAPALVGAVFGSVEVERWEIVAYVLPHRDAIADYLHAINVPDWVNRAALLSARSASPSSAPTSGPELEITAEPSVPRARAGRPPARRAAGCPTGR